MKFLNLGLFLLLGFLELEFVLLVDLLTLTDFDLHLSFVGASLLMKLAITNRLVDVLVVVLAVGRGRKPLLRNRGLQQCLLFSFEWFSLTSNLMLEKLLDRGVNVHVEVHAVVEGLAAAILAPRDVVLLLALVKELVVSIKGAKENLDFLIFGLH